MASYTQKLLVKDVLLRVCLFIYLTLESKSGYLILVSNLYSETDDFWTCEIHGGFPRGYEADVADFNLHDIQGYRAPPAGGCIILALDKDKLGTKGGGKLGGAGTPKADRKQF